MTKDIRSLFLRLSTAKEIWKAVKNTYSVDQDASKAYQVHCEVIFVCQNGDSVISYLENYRKYGRSLMILMTVLWSVPNDIAIYITKVNFECVYKFLVGLDPYLDGVRGRVLYTKPLPGIQAAYAMNQNQQSLESDRAGNDKHSMIWSVESYKQWLEIKKKLGRVRFGNQTGG
ncbi:hypothetical protein Vadar_028316 [Vaccinium darrowii]|uniref:Uncharacterized protein n=1 Tax=Vaccinium darrowii TaxID=229202 RepID=A0ACB7Z7G2_9ERIC|nr:hypothetical protein Vadar_028316 [Vaccinium darrowii]